MERAVVAFAAHDIGRFLIATNDGIGVAQGVRTQGFKGRGQGFIEVLFGLDDDFGIRQKPVAQPAGLRGDCRPGFFPYVDNIGLESPQDAAQSGIKVQIILRGAEPR